MVGLEVVPNVIAVVSALIAEPSQSTVITVTIKAAAPLALVRASVMRVVGFNLEKKFNAPQEETTYEETN